ncbi:hypothetical protein E1264_21595 [Actinomadura sp. KC216]|uniref:hypothetical protein n=1 Tax=Actinomadura sp. KC216 TaxID=2530370 RepID=UPI001043ADC3|nr:hypothetical protein [Actinomadura sp. KC216]TDB85300.1 hypothetical protein E1264_21595 [Actinomadura sp. KC216]
MSEEPTGARAEAPDREPPDTGAAPDGGQRAIGQLVEIAGRVLASTGVLTAILYYFGYVRERALFSYFGIDLGTVGFTTTDYLVVSAGPVFSPLASVMVFGVGALVAHHLLVHLLRGASHRMRVLVCLLLTALAFTLLTIGAVSLHRHADDAVSGPYLSPAALGGGTLLLEYVAEAATRYGVARGGWSEILASTRPVRRLMLIALALIAAFWATANAAQEHGIDAARAIELSLPTSPQAVVYSRQRLHITGSGVAVLRLDAKDAAFSYRYNGLRTLAHEGGRWFLLPVGWTRHNGATVILLPDSTKDIRVDLAP